MLSEILNPKMYHNYEVVDISFLPGSLIITTPSMVDHKYHWHRNGDPNDLVSAKQAEKTSGIGSRRWAAPHETNISMAVSVSKKVLHTGNLTAEEAEHALDKVRIMIINTSSADRGSGQHV